MNVFGLNMNKIFSFKDKTMKKKPVVIGSSIEPVVVDRYVRKAPCSYEGPSDTIFYDLLYPNGQIRKALFIESGLIFSNGVLSFVTQGMESLVTNKDGNAVYAKKLPIAFYSDESTDSIAHIIENHEHALFFEKKKAAAIIYKQVPAAPIKGSNNTKIIGLAKVIYG